jgi:hypothetical protein
MRVVNVFLAIIMTLGMILSTATPVAAIGLSINTVSPGEGTNDLDTTITIDGTGFDATVKAYLINGDFVTGLESVLVSDTRLSATVPWGLPGGNYDLKLTKTGEDAVTAAAAFTVQDTLGTAITNGPYGGDVRSIAVYDSNTVFAAASNSNLFRSTDGGDSWSAVFANVQGGQVVTDGTYVYVSRPQTYLFRSSNAGGSWTGIPINTAGMKTNEQEDQHPFLAPGGDLYSVVWGANSPEAKRGIYKSTNQGAGWSQVAAAEEWSSSATVLAFDGSTIYAGVENGDIWVSSDGTTWTKIHDTTGDDLDFINDLDVHGGVLWASGNGAGHDGSLWKGTSGDPWTWEQIDQNPDPGVEDYIPATQVVIANGGEIFVAAGGQHIVYSNDNGATWSALHEGIDDETMSIALADPSANPLTIYEGLKGNGVYKSADGGSNWVAQNNGFAAIVADYLAAKPDDPRAMFAAVADGIGTLRTADGGQTWSVVHNGVGGPLAVDPTEPDRIYTAAGYYGAGDELLEGGSIWISDDNGNTWNHTLLSMPEGYTDRSTYLLQGKSLVALPGSAAGATALLLGYQIVNKSNYNEVIYAGIKRSSNSGATWVDVYGNANLDSPINLAFDPQTPSLVYGSSSLMKPDRPSAVGSVPVFLKSAAGGVNGSWALSELDSTVYPGEFGGGLLPLAVDPRNHKIAAVDGFLVYISANNGASWTLSSTQPQWGVNVWANQVLWSGGSVPVLYAATAAGLYRSIDDGRNWSKVASDSLGNTNIQAMTMTKAEDGRAVLYLSTSGGSSGAGASKQEADREAAAGIIDTGVYRFTDMTAPLLTTPTNNGRLPYTPGAKKFKTSFNWKPISSATQYELQYGASPAFAKGMVKKITTGTSVALTLGLNKTIYWRVRYYSGKAAGSWSETRVFSSPNPPNTPKLSLPKKGKILPPTSILKWSAKAKPPIAYFNLKVDDSAAFDSPAIDAATLNATPSYNIPAGVLQENTRYYWKVQSCNEYEECSAWAKAYNFITPPEKATLIALVNPNTTPLFQWNAALHGPASYEFQASTDPNLKSGFVLKSKTKTNSFQAPAGKFQPGVTYYWQVRIRGQGAKNFGPWSDAGSFTPVP